MKIIRFFILHEKDYRPYRPIAIQCPCSIFLLNAPLRPDEHLGPVFGAFAVGRNTDTDLGKACIQDVGSMSRGIHPTVHNLRRCAVAVCNVFSRRGVANTEITHHIQRGSRR